MSNRERFEAWARQNAPHFSKDDYQICGPAESWPGQYSGFRLQLMWEGWQAAKAESAQGAELVAWDDPAVDPIVSKLYRKFKEWSQRGFTADDVTWCEVRGYVAELLNAPQPAQQGGVPVTITYKNWRGVTRDRLILPQSVRFGATEWHPEPQWLLSSLDVEKMEMRDFALKDIGTTSPGSEWRVASSITGSLPDLGVPVIGHNPAWINEDFNPRGIRECFRTGDGTEWVNAYWWDEQDCYEAKDGAPTLWQPYPQPPRERQEGK